MRPYTEAREAVGAVEKIVTALAAEKTEEAGRADEAKRRNFSFVDPYRKSVTVEVTETEIPVVMDRVTAAHLKQKAELEKPNSKK